MQSRGVRTFLDDIYPTATKNYVLELEKSDLVNASKKHPLPKVSAPLSRKMSRCVALGRLATGIKVKDTQAALKAGNTAILEDFQNHEGQALCI